VAVAAGIVWIIGAALLGLFGFLAIAGGGDPAWGWLFGLLGLTGVFTGIWMIGRHGRRTALGSLVLAAAYIVVGIIAVVAAAPIAVWPLLLAIGVVAGALSAITVSRRPSD
jgi:hypothetical protein